MADGFGAYLTGGKRLRAGLVSLIGMAGASRDEDAILRYAAFVELIHAGGLCHDDIVDHSLVRRGRPSVGRVYGETRAAIGGTYLMVRAFRLVAGDTTRVRELIAEVAHRVARGQAGEMTDLFREDVGVEEYLARAADKTGALFGLAARLGAISGGFSAQQEATLLTFGERMGLAYQLADDVRDLIGEAALGRECGTDIREGVYTLPVLLTLHEQRDGWRDLRARLRRVRVQETRQDIEACCRIVWSSGAVSATQDLMRCILDQALAAATVIGGKLGHGLACLANEVTYCLDGAPA